MGVRVKFAGERLHDRRAPADDAEPRPLRGLRRGAKNRAKDDGPSIHQRVLLLAAAVVHSAHLRYRGLFLSFAADSSDFFSNVLCCIPAPIEERFFFQVAIVRFWRRIVGIFSEMFLRSSVFEILVF